MNLLENILPASAVVVNTTSKMRIPYAEVSYTAGRELFAPITNILVYFFTLEDVLEYIRR